MWLYSATPGVTPRVRALSLALRDEDRAPVDGPSDRLAWGTVLEVPGLSHDKVHVTYKREELWRAFCHSQGAAYLIWPAGTPLPAGAVPAVP